MQTDNVEQLNRLAWREGKSLKQFSVSTLSMFTYFLKYFLFLKNIKIICFYFIKIIFNISASK
jgi:hypothetical protein